jgi:hypothetical protein
MNTIDYVYKIVIPATFSLLPPKMNSSGACAALLAIGLQESKFKDRRQVGGGPARGFWQFEAGGGVHGVVTHSASATLVTQAMETLRYRPDQCYAALEHNDVLACIFARLLLWTHPAALPGRADPEGAWNYYLSLWRPGKPHRETWHANYERAWEVVSE